MKKYLFSLCIISTLCACQMAYVPQARDIKRKPRNNGIVGIPLNHRPEDRQKADELMKQNCGALPVTVVDEGETVIGQETKSTGSETNRDDSRRHEGNFLGMNIMSGMAAGKETSQSSVTTQLKEWQISYNCETVTQNNPKKTK